MVTTLDELLVKLRRTGNRHDDGCMMHRELINPDGPAAADALEAAARENERLRTLMRGIVNHATGGSSQDINASINDICVAITESRNRVFKAGQEHGARNALSGGPHE